MSTGRAKRKPRAAPAAPAKQPADQAGRTVPDADEARTRTTPEPDEARQRTS